MCELCEDLKVMQQFMLGKLIEATAKLEATLETLDAYNVIDPDDVMDNYEDAEARVIEEFEEGASEYITNDEDIVARDLDPCDGFGGDNRG